MHKLSFVSRTSSHSVIQRSRIQQAQNAKNSGPTSSVVEIEESEFGVGTTSGSGMVRVLILVVGFIILSMSDPRLGVCYYSTRGCHGNVNPSRAFLHSAIALD